MRKLLVGTLMILGVAASCAGDDAKRVIGESAGEGGEAGSALSSSGSSSLGGTSGTGGQGPGGDGPETAAGAGQSNGGNQGAGAPGGGGSPSGGAGATSSDAGGDGGAAVGEGGAGGDAGTQVSRCGAGMYDAGEGFCATCVAPTSVQTACAAYGNVLASSSNGNLLYARLTPAVGFFEPFPAALVVSFVTPTMSVATSAAFNPSNGSWFINLDAGPDAPSEFTIPPFTTTGACGHAYESTQAIHFVRTGPDTYTHSCP